MRVAVRITLAGCLLLAGAGANAQTAEIALVPAGADGAFTIVGNELRLANPGQRVFLEVWVSGWGPTGVRRLAAWQAAIDSSGYSNGTLGVLSPASTACAVADDCTATFGGACSVGGTVCNQDVDCPFPEAGDSCEGPLCDFPYRVGGFCSPIFFLSSRPDYVFKGLTDFRGVDVHTSDFVFVDAVFSTDSVVDPGTPLYAATLVLDVPENASGVYEIGFFAHTSNKAGSVLVGDDSRFIEPLTLTPARIFVACVSNVGCDDGNACTTDVCRADDTCGHAPNFDDTRSCCNLGSGDACTKARGVLGDGNLDGHVDLRDFASLQSRCFGSVLIPFRCEPFDTDCNCRVDVGDLPDYVAGMNGPAAP